MFERVMLKETLMLVCKQCRHPVSDSTTVAYHLMNGILYGWCEDCFQRRHSNPNTGQADQPRGILKELVDH
jgi:hypothetical protein